MLEKIKGLFGFRHKRKKRSKVTIMLVDRVIMLRALGVKQVDIAKTVGVAESVVSNILNGKHKLTQRR